MTARSSSQCSSLLLLLLLLALGSASCNARPARSSRTSVLADAPVQWTASPPPLLLAEDALTCDPIPSAAGSSSHAQIQHIALVDAHQSHSDDDTTDAAAPPNFLFRGALPDRDNFANHSDVQPADYKSEFLYADLLAGLRAAAAETAADSSVSASLRAAAAAFPAADADTYLIDVNLMWHERADDASRIDAEYAWFAQHAISQVAGAAKGELLSWETHGTRVNISREYAEMAPAGAKQRRRQVSRNSELATALRAGHPPAGYEAPDQLSERVAKLVQLLHNARAPGSRPRSVVIYVHCFCGTDRTGEVMGAYALQHQRRSWREAMAENERIGGRPIACANYRALQLFCLQVEGERQQRLGCERNQQCVEWV